MYKKLEKVIFMIEKLESTIIWKLTWKLIEVKTHNNKNLSKYKEI